MSEPRTRGKGLRVLMRLAVVTLLVPFIAAPTPGNVGGCGGSEASTAVAPGPYQSTDPPETVEWEFFDRGLCAGVCQRLRDCNVLCEIVDQTDAGFTPDNPCVNDSPYAFRACMRGKWDPRAFVGLPEAYGYKCPHACPPGTTLSAPPLEWDVQVCNDAVMQMSCPSGYGDMNSVLGVFQSSPNECLHLCQ